MAYVFKFVPGQQIYLDNQGEQTIITSLMSAPGQQQQATNRFTTGLWTAPPQMFQTTAGVFIKLMTARGEVQIQVQGQNFQLRHNHSNLEQAQAVQCSQVNTMPEMLTMEPMEPMKPMTMEPLTMGDMKMGFNPMQMQMGNMKMQMGRENSTVVNPIPKAGSSKQKFCTQCGQKVEMSDRFCSSCGHDLRQ